jgi:nitroreductase
MATWPESVSYPEFKTGTLNRSSFFRSAPAAIAVVAKAYKYSLDALLAMRAVSDQKAVKIREGRAIANARIQSVASATAYLLLVLHQMGLGAVWMTGPMQAKEEVEEILKVPDGMDLVAFIPVGYPGENPAPKPRKPITEVCQVIK